jgi:hypothetical protein
LRLRSQFEISLFRPNSVTANARCSTSAFRVPRYSWLDVKYIPDIITASTTTPKSAVISATPRRWPSSFALTGVTGSIPLRFSIEDLT